MVFNDLPIEVWRISFLGRFHIPIHLIDLFMPTSSVVQPFHHSIMVFFKLFNSHNKAFSRPEQQYMRKQVYQEIYKYIIFYKRIPVNFEINVLFVSIRKDFWSSGTGRACLYSRGIIPFHNNVYWVRQIHCTLNTSFFSGLQYIRQLKFHAETGLIPF